MEVDTPSSDAEATMETGQEIDLDPIFLQAVNVQFQPDTTSAARKATCIQAASKRKWDRVDVEPEDATVEVEERPEELLDPAVAAKVAEVRAMDIFHIKGRTGEHHSMEVEQYKSAETGEYVCPEEWCNKAYKSAHGLQYHFERSVCELPVC